MKRIFASLVIIAMLLSCSCAINTTLGEPNKQVVQKSDTSQGLKGELYDLTATDIKGNELSDLFSGNKLTMINVWATWCSPCISELPAIQQLSEDYAQKGVAVYGILFDSEDRGALDEANSILNEKGVSYTQIKAIGDAKSMIIETYEISALPTTLFVNENGEIVDTVIGANDYSQWQSRLDSLLNK